MNQFPPTHVANAQGLLAIGGQFNANELIFAYRQGIFPWFNEGDPCLWWSPNPRMVFYPSDFHYSKSLLKTLRQKLQGEDSPWVISVNQHFKEVMQACALREEGSWIHGEYFNAYSDLFDQGYGFCLALINRSSQHLMGGLYGVQMGKMFFGESMFSRVSNASKCLLAVWMSWLRQHDCPLMDAQVVSEHLLKLGAVSVSREIFEADVQTLVSLPKIEIPSFLTWNEGH